MKRMTCSNSRWKAANQLKDKREREPPDGAWINVPRTNELPTKHYTSSSAKATSHIRERGDLELGLPFFRPDFVSCLCVATRHRLCQGTAFGSPERCTGRDLPLSLAVLRNFRGILPYTILTFEFRSQYSRVCLSPGSLETVTAGETW
jgi:hypothetical protein